MTVRNLFEQQGLDETIARINELDANTKGQWGKMSVSQMLAHCCVAYEMDHENTHPKPGAIAKFMIKLFAKSAVVGPKPYPRNGRTAPQFLIKDEKDFETEKSRLLNYLQKTKELGAKAYDQRDSHSFGALSTQEWNTLYSKHLDHHLTQFGV